jgi:hypothetical protein
MKKLTEIISFLALLLIVLAPSLFYCDRISLELNKTLMLIATFAWFASSLCWMGREKQS